MALLTITLLLTQWKLCFASVTGPSRYTTVRPVFPNVAEEHFNESRATLSYVNAADTSYKGLPKGAYPFAGYHTQKQ